MKKIHGLRVLYEDHRILALNKPAGLPVQGGAGIIRSLDSILAENYNPRPLLVHRLDKDTSGVIIAAKTKESAAILASLFSGEKKGGDDEELKKTYSAICAGIPAGIPDKEQIIDRPLFKNGRSLSAITAYVRKGTPGLIEDFPVSLVEIKPYSGRMHQIRVHFAQCGCPILGDDKYGDFSLNKRLKKNLGLKALFLHASSIYLPSFLNKSGMEISVPLPDYFCALIQKAGISQ